MRIVFSWVADIEASGFLANPLGDALVLGAFHEGFDAIEGLDVPLPELSSGGSAHL
jgi:hypothetical protein